MAGIGPDKTTIEIWVDPAAERNTKGKGRGTEDSKGKGKDGGDLMQAVVDASKAVEWLMGGPLEGTPEGDRAASE